MGTDDLLGQLYKNASVSVDRPASYSRGLGGGVTILKPFHTLKLWKLEYTAGFVEPRSSEIKGLVS